MHQKFINTLISSITHLGLRDTVTNQNNAWLFLHNTTFVFRSKYYHVMCTRTFLED